MDRERHVTGWGRTVLSTYWHWFDSEFDEDTDNPAAPPLIRSVCETIGCYKGSLVPEIARWEFDPSICEICREIRTARAAGRVSKSEPMRMIAIVPPGLPDRIRAVMDSPKNDATSSGSPPFYVALSQFRSEGVTKPFLLALLRYEAERAGKRSLLPKKWWDTVIDEVRETEGATRVSLQREARRVPR